MRGLKELDKEDFGGAALQAASFQLEHKKAAEDRSCGGFVMQAISLHAR